MLYVPCVHVCSVTHLWPTLCDPMDPWTIALQAPLHGILQARILEWFAISCFPGGSVGKASVCNVGDLGSLPRSGSPGEGNGNPLQYPCLENPMDGGAWCPWGRKGSDTTKQLHFHFHSNNIYVFSSKYSFSCIPQFMVCIITVIKPVYITVSNARKFSFPIPLHMPLSPQNQNALSNYF